MVQKLMYYETARQFHTHINKDQTCIAQCQLKNTTLPTIVPLPLSTANI